MKDRRFPHCARMAVLALAAVLAAFLAFSPAAMADAFTPESGGSPNADDIDTLYKIVLYCAIPIFLLVEGVLIWTLVKFRARREGPAPAQIRGNTPLEVGWTVAAALLLVVLGVITFLYLGNIEKPQASQAGGLSRDAQVASIDQPAPPKEGGQTLKIGVNGQQYLFRYDYPGKDRVFSYHEMVVPVNTTVTLDVTSQDVIHSWWIPKLGGKVDAVPGYTNETWFRIAKPGVYRGQCAELCGAGHADMRAVVRAVPPAEYESWIKRQAADIEAAQEALAEQRRKGEGGQQ